MTVSKKNLDRARQAIEAAKRDAERQDAKLGGYSISNHMDEIQVYHGCAEPGYEDGPMVIGNWNNVDKYDSVKRERTDVSTLPSRLCNVLEKLGLETRYSDEWASCNDCGKLVRTSPDSYSWTPSYALVNECELLCHECIEEDSSDYLEGLENNPSTAMTLDIDPTAHGYVRMNEHEYENGFHEGQNDSPKEILADLESKGYQRVLFKISEASQFYMKFDVYVHESDIERMEEEKEEAAREAEEAERASARMKEEWRRDDELARQHEDEQNERDLFED
jgi:hypothetical protein